MSAKETPSSTAPVRKIKPFFILFTLATIVFVLYFNSLQGEFVYDDKIMISTYELVKDIKNIPKAFVSPTNLYGNTNYYRPLQTITYIIDYFLWGNDSTGFHVSNVIFHALVVLAVYFLVDILFYNRIYSFLTALLFAIHPVNSSVVSYIASRADSMFAFFVAS